MYNKLQFLQSKNIRVFLPNSLRYVCCHVIIQLQIPPRSSLFVRLPDREGGAGRDWRKFSCRIFFKMASLRLPLVDSIRAMHAAGTAAWEFIYNFSAGKSAECSSMCCSRSTIRTNSSILLAITASAASSVSGASSILASALGMVVRSGDESHSSSCTFTWFRISQLTFGRSISHLAEWTHLPGLESDASDASNIARLTRHLLRLLRRPNRYLCTY